MQTPDVHARISKRHFDSRVKDWRKALHVWDVPEAAAVAAAESAAAVPTVRGVTRASGELRGVCVAGRAPHHTQQRRADGCAHSSESTTPPRLPCLEPRRA